MANELIKQRKYRWVPPTWTSQTAVATFYELDVKRCVDQLRLNWDNLKISEVSQMIATTGGKPSKVLADFATAREQRYVFGLSVCGQVDKLLSGCWTPQDHSRCIDALALVSERDEGRTFCGKTLHTYWVFATMDYQHRESTVIHHIPLSKCDPLIRAQYQLYVRNWYKINYSSSEKEIAWEDLNRGLGWHEDKMVDNASSFEAEMSKPSTPDKLKVCSGSYAFPMKPLDEESKEAIDNPRPSLIPSSYNVMIDGVRSKLYAVKKATSGQLPVSEIGDLLEQCESIINETVIIQDQLNGMLSVKDCINIGR